MKKIWDVFSQICTGVFCLYFLFIVGGTLGAPDICASHCLHEPCYKKTTTCSRGCVDGYVSAWCNVSCSYFCKNRACDNTGKCTRGCKKGFTGTRCLKTKVLSLSDFDFYQIIMTGLIWVMMIFPVVLVLGCIMERRRRNKEASKPQPIIIRDEVRRQRKKKKGRENPATLKDTVGPLDSLTSQKIVPRF